jgi:hypothetical protein
MCRARFEKVVMKALLKDREQRYATAPDFAREFAAAIVEKPSGRRGDTVVEKPEPAPRPQPPPPPRPDAKPSPVQRLVGYALLLVMAGVTWYASSVIRGKHEPVRQTPIATAVDQVQAGTIRVNPKDGLKYVSIPPGNFQMGCSAGDTQCYDDEKPAHEVTISKGFWLGADGRYASGLEESCEYRPKPF